MSIRKYIVLILTGILLCRLSSAAQIPALRHVTISGHTVFTDSEIRKRVNPKTNPRLTCLQPDTVIHIMREAYRKEGYFAMQVDSIALNLAPDSTSADIVLRIHEGEPVAIEQLDFHSDLKEEPQSLQSIRLDLLRLQGKRYQEVLLEGLLDDYLTESANVGYPLARIEFLDAEIQTDSGSPALNLTYRYHSGPPVRIDTIRIVGNELTRDAVILRELRFEPGDLFNQKQVEAGRDNLQRLGFFKSVDKPEFHFIDDGAVVTYRVREGHPNTIDGLIGYTPPASDEPGAKGIFTGRLELTFTNLMGTGRLLEAFWQKKEDDSQSIRFQYEEPWIGGYPVFAGLQFEQIIRDSTYLERDRQLSLRYTPWSTFSLELTAGQKDILPDSLGSVLLGLQESKRRYVSIGLDYQTFDDSNNPTRGVHYGTQLYKGLKQKEGETESADYQSVLLDVEWVYSLFYRQVFFMGLHGREVKIGDGVVPLEDQIRLGGANTLRGYHEDSFSGHLVVWMNQEYRLLTGPQSRAFLFCDMGLFEKYNEAEERVKKLKIGYGLGLRLETALGRIGIDYGLAYGDGFLQGKIHVGLQNQF